MDLIDFSLCDIKDPKVRGRDRMTIDSARKLNESYQLHNSNLRWLPTHFVGKWMRCRQSTGYVSESRIQEIAEELTRESL